MNLFTLFAKLGLDSSEYEKGLNKALSVGKKAGVTLGKTLGTLTAITATGIGVLSKLAVENYSEYEQLVGGVDTLFKDSSAKLQQYAAGAYATAGMDANSYMENVTGFAAALISSLEGDTDKAADIANMALVDISDNANKMGTAQESLVLAYQGFAKQQYQLLDNLKLGYGGTRGEMERLLKDAEKISGVKYDISNLADVYTAIHVIQEELGIVNATRDEALTTIQGSANAAKAAWQNLLTGIADPTQDLDLLINNFVESAVTFSDNLLPAVEKSLDGIVRLADGLAPLIIARLPSIVKNVTPGLIQAIMNMGKSAGTAIPELILVLLDILADNSPMISEGALFIVTALLQGLADNAPEMIPGVLDIIFGIADTLTKPSNLTPLVSSGFDLIVALAFGLVDGLPILLNDVAPSIIENLVESLIELTPELLAAGGKLMVALFEGMLRTSPSEVGINIGKSLIGKVDEAESQFSALEDPTEEMTSGTTYGAITKTDQSLSIGEQTFNLQVGEETISTVVVDIMKKEARME